MGWPKGKPRAGYIKKDGTAPLRRGGRIAQVRIDPETYKQIAKPEDGRVEKTLHGMTGRPVIEICPACSYAYADGGYCEDCGWTTWKGRGK